MNLLLKQFEQMKYGMNLATRALVFLWQLLTAVSMGTILLLRIDGQVLLILDMQDIQNVHGMIPTLDKMIFRLIIMDMGPIQWAQSVEVILEIR